MRRLRGPFVLSVVILLTCGLAVAAADTVTCEEVVEAQDEALASADRAITELRAALTAAEAVAKLQTARADIAERQIVVITASYEREIGLLDKQLRAGRWRRIFDTVVAGSVGFSIGTVVDDK